MTALKKSIEAILFVAPEPVSLEVLSSVLEAEEELIEKVLQELKRDYHDRGLHLFEVAGGYSFRTSSQVADQIECFLQIRHRQKLTRSQLEVLAVVAYQQPVTRSQLAEFRGVQSDSILYKLQDFGLVEKIGEAESIGRPSLYGTTSKFLSYFGLNSIEEIPSLADFEYQVLEESVEELLEVESKAEHGETHSTLRETVYGSLVGETSMPEFKDKEEKGQEESGLKRLLSKIKSKL